MPEQTEHRFEAIRPFGPTIMAGTLPESLIKLLDDKAQQIMDDEKMSKDLDWSHNLAGNVKQEVRYPQEWLSSNEFGPMTRSLDMIVNRYLSSPPNSDTIDPKEVEGLVMTSMWCVSQWAGDFNPSHIHDGDISGIIYLRIPPSLEKEYAQEDHYPCVGDVQWQCGQASTFNGHQFKVSPKIGQIYLFPAWLTHMVYPFRTQNEERRSVSFNIDVKRKKDRQFAPPKIKND